jgi:predicted nucleic acid-binding protein
MPYLFDSNTLLRLAEHNSPERPTVIKAIRSLRLQNEILVYTPQVLSEFWNVCTRPSVSRSGLQLSIGQTERKAKLIEKYFKLIPDSILTYNEWRRLVFDLGVKGVQVHDTKLVASMVVHNIRNLITYNVQDFRRFGMINAIHPADAH